MLIVPKVPASETAPGGCNLVVRTGCRANIEAEYGAGGQFQSAAYGKMY